MIFTEKGQDEEVQLLRDFIKAGLDSPIMNPEMKARRQAKLDLLDEVEFGTKEYQSCAPLFSATLDYGATGEGSTQVFFATRAYTKGAFLRTLCGRIGHYFCLGATIYQGLPPENDPVLSLVGPTTWKQLRREVEADRRCFGGGTVSVFLSQHFNHS